MSAFRFENNEAQNPPDPSEMKKLLSELSDNLLLFALLAVLAWSVYLILSKVTRSSLEPERKRARNSK
jgi:hypothetical protein